MSLRIPAALQEGILELARMFANADQRDIQTHLMRLLVDVFREFMTGHKLVTATMVLSPIVAEVSDKFR